MNHVCVFSHVQIAFTQTSAQEKAEQAAAKSRAHTDLDEEETGHTPNPVPLTSPSHIVRKWTTASPLDIMKLQSPHGSAHKVRLTLVSLYTHWDNVIVRCPSYQRI